MVRNVRRHKRLLVTFAGTIALVAGGAVIATTSSSASTSPTLTEGQIKAEALAFAAGSGDTTPTSMEHVKSTRQQAVLALSGDEVPGNEDVYAIAMQGHFVASNARVAPRSPAPHGSVLTLVIDATTGQLTDFGVQNEVPYLESLGSVTTDQ
jgi:hypothetical protein